MLRLPAFDVVVWLRKTEAFSALRDELIRLAVVEPDEWSEDQGVVDFHWGFESLTQAKRTAETLTVLCGIPELVLLRVSNNNDLDASITYKDQRGRLD
jgi:hypothetical protein